eukprot:gene13531-biopygen501
MWDLGAISAKVGPGAWRNPLQRKGHALTQEVKRLGRPGSHFCTCWCSVYFPLYMNTSPPGENGSGRGPDAGRTGRTRTGRGRCRFSQGEMPRD